MLMINLDSIRENEGKAIVINTLGKWFSFHQNSAPGRKIYPCWCFPPLSGTCKILNLLNLVKET